MKKSIIIIFCGAIALSCNHKLYEGIYRFENDSEISIKRNNLYEFKSLNQALPFRFSMGSYNMNNNIITFIPDSNYLLRIQVKEAYFDSSVIGKQKIILESTSNIKLDDFVFYTLNNLGDTFNFNNNSIGLFDINKFNRTQISIFARFDDSIEIVMPGYYNKTIVSNVVNFSSIYVEFGKQNVIKLEVKINPEMFSFIRLSQYLYTKRKLVKRDWPIYNFIK